MDSPFILNNPACHTVVCTLNETSLFSPCNALEFFAEVPQSVFLDRPETQVWILASRHPGYHVRLFMVSPPTAFIFWRFLFIAIDFCLSNTNSQIENMASYESVLARDWDLHSRIMTIDWRSRWPLEHLFCILTGCLTVLSVYAHQGPYPAHWQQILI